MDRTFGPMATTSAQTRRLPIWAVAGMRMPPVERRSPSSLVDVDEDAVVQHLDGQAAGLAGLAAVGLGGHGADGTVAVHARRHLRGHLDHRRRHRPSTPMPRRAQDDAAEAPWASVVLCHPHPQFGGNRQAGLVSHLFSALPAAGVRTLRFDFRGVGRSTGTHGGGGPERADVAAAVEAWAVGHRRGPLVTVGWSFGGDVSLATDHPLIDRWCAIAPPLHVIEPSTMAAATDPRPTLLCVPEHDEFRPPAEAAAIVADWAETDGHDDRRCLTSGAGPLRGRHRPRARLPQRRTVMPRAAMWSLASPTVCSPKWKIDAASTASAPPSVTPSAR